MKKTIVCFGDSNTHGYDPYTGGRYDESIRWTCQLQELLGERARIVEEGLSGRTTVFDDPLHECMSGLDSIYSCLMSHEPVDILVIMLGTNDSKERLGQNAPCIGLGLKRLVEKAQSLKEAWRDGNPTIVVITPQAMEPEYWNNPDAGWPMGQGCDIKTKALHPFYEKWAKQLGCYYMDANTALTAPTNEVDYTHLKPEGHSQLAKALAKNLEEEWKLV